MPHHSDAHPVDHVVADLLALYGRADADLARIVRDALARGLDPERIGTPRQQKGDATIAYRQRQREQAQALIAELVRQTESLAPLVVQRAYRSGLIAVDRTLGDRVKVRGEFGRVHVRSVETLATNMTASLTDAATRAGRSTAAVFDAADRLEGPLPTSGRVADVPFVGRRVNDAYRRLAVETVAEGQIKLDTRRQVTATLVRRIKTEGLTDATTGFVDRAGRRWPLSTYGQMVARTTTREATTAATRNRIVENGQDLVTVSTHDHPADECTPYEGRTFSLTGRTAGYPVLDVLPPFHPNCVHVLLPASASLDAFEAELEDAVG